MDGSHLVMENGKIIMKHVQFKNISTEVADSAFWLDVSCILNQEAKNSIIATEWEVSKDLKQVLITSDYTKGWRHSSFASYWIYDTTTKVNRRLNTSSSTKNIPGALVGGKIALALFSRGGESVLWVRDNDLYVTTDGQEVQITTDGSKNVMNGISDWVYEEEIVSGPQSAFFSPNGKRIAFVKYNDTLVQEYHIQFYRKYGKTAYPREIDIKYPKPGTPNPVAHIYLSSINAETQKATTSMIDFGTKDFDDADRIVTQISWLSDDTVLVRLMNRVQDHQRIYAIQTLDGGKSWNSRLLRDERTPDGAWFNRMQPIYRLGDLSKKDHAYVEIMDHPSGYAHIAFFADLKTISPTAWLTSGPFDVIDINGVSKDLTIYYTSAEVNSMQRHIYRYSNADLVYRSMASNRN